MDKATLPSDIEVFRAGRHIDDQGVKRHYTRADIVQMAEGYDPATHVVCPECRELVLKEARLCKHCWTRLRPQ